MLLCTMFMSKRWNKDTELTQQKKFLMQFYMAQILSSLLFASRITPLFNKNNF